MQLQHHNKNTTSFNSHYMEMIGEAQIDTQVLTKIEGLYDS